MKEIAEYLITKIVDNPEEVKVNQTESNGRVIIGVSVNTNDIGKVLGKKGKNIEAMRTILKAISAKNKKGCSLDLIEE